MSQKTIGRSLAMSTTTAPLVRAGLAQGPDDPLPLPVSPRRFARLATVAL